MGRVDARVAAGPGGNAGIAVYAWKGETLAEDWWCTLRALVWPDGSGPNPILDGGDATMLGCLGAEYEEAGAIPASDTADSEEFRIVLELLHAVRVARLHLAKFGVRLTELSQDQADYIGVPVAGPYKAEHYRY